MVVRWGSRGEGARVVFSGSVLVSGGSPVREDALQALYTAGSCKTSPLYNIRRVLELEMLHTHCNRRVASVAPCSFCVRSQPHPLGNLTCAIVVDFLYNTNAGQTLRERPALERSYCVARWVAPVA